MLVARAFQVRGNAQKPRVHFNGLNSELTKSVVMARIPGAVGKYSIYCLALNRIPRSHFRTLDPRSNWRRFNDAHH